MARPKLPPDDVRRSTIGVRVSPAEYAVLQEKATAAGMTPAQWLRSAALAREVPAVVPAVNIAMSEEVRRLGVNLNQIALRRNLGQDAELSPDVLADLLDTLGTIRRVLLGVSL